MSDKTQPAPGPWVAAETIPAHDGYPAVWQIDAEHHAVCTTQFCYAENTAANARLIAAAPDGLALARNLERWLKTDIEKSHISADDMRVYHLDGAVLSNLLNEARAFIAKATGA